MQSRKYRGVTELWKNLRVKAGAANLTLEEIRAIWKDPELHKWVIGEYQKGRRELESVLLRVNRGLLRSVVNRYAKGREPDLDDLYQEGRLALLEAFARYDVAQNVAPSTYAWSFLRSYIRRFVEQEGAVVRFPSHRYRAIPESRGLKTSVRYVFNFSEMPENPISSADWSTFEERIADVRPDVEEILNEHELDTSYPALVDFLLTDLPDRTRAILKYRYSSSPPPTLVEAGKRWGISRERVRQIEVVALRICRSKSRILGVDARDFRSFEEWALVMTFELAKRRAALTLPVIP